MPKKPGLAMISRNSLNESRRIDFPPAASSVPRSVLLKKPDSAVTFAACPDAMASGVNPMSGTFQMYDVARAGGIENRDLLAELDRRGADRGLHLRRRRHAGGGESELPEEIVAAAVDRIDRLGIGRPLAAARYCCIWVAMGTRGGGRRHWRNAGKQRDARAAVRVVVAARQHRRRCRRGRSVPRTRSARRDPDWS